MTEAEFEVDVFKKNKKRSERKDETGRKYSLRKNVTLVYVGSDDGET